MAMSNAEKCSLYYMRHKEERLQYAKRYEFMRPLLLPYDCDAVQDVGRAVWQAD